MVWKVQSVTMRLCLLLWGGGGAEQGSFFIVKRATPPWHQILILNRRSSTNVQNAIQGKFECEYQHPFLLYRTDDGQVGSCRAQLEQS